MYGKSFHPALPITLQSSDNYLKDVLIQHQPVMVDEVISALNLKPGSKVLDATIGGGGHAREILQRIIPGGLLIGVDQDPAAIIRSRSALRGFESSLILAQGNFRSIDLLTVQNGAGKLDAAIFDIGVSSFQLDDGARGFSLRTDAPLDMRMDPSLSTSAVDIVNRLKESELADIIWKYGEERYSRKIARRIVDERSKRRICTTGELVTVIRSAVGGRYLKQRINPATRTFQAIRIAVNDELGALEEGLNKTIDILNTGGRIAVIAFHSLEDRIVKNTFREYAKNDILKLVTKKPMRPSMIEVKANPRSRSARLRVAEKI